MTQDEQVAACRHMVHAKLARIAIQDRLLSRADELEKEGNVAAAMFIRSLISAAADQIRRLQWIVNQKF